MSEVADRAGYGVLADPLTLKIQRRLPGPIEQVWAYLTESELRGRWLARGDMELTEGGRVELIWRNDELSDAPAQRPDGFAEEMRMETRVRRVEPPRLLAFGWNDGSEVTFELEPQGSEVLLTVTHRRLPDRDTLLKVAAGWHTHLDIWVDQANRRPAQPFWPAWQRLHAEYDARLS